jgi:hypothetical protein
VEKESINSSLLEKNIKEIFNEVLEIPEKSFEFNYKEYKDALVIDLNLIGFVNDYEFHDIEDLKKHLEEKGCECFLQKVMHSDNGIFSFRVIIAERSLHSVLKGE